MHHAVNLILVGLLWGATNPFIKKGSKNITKVKSNSLIFQFLLEIKYLITNVEYIIPMGLNQLGSVIYFLTLQNSAISLAVPLANSLSFVFTAIAGILLKEKAPGKKTFLGVTLVLVGSFLCFYDKYLQEVK